MKEKLTPYQILNAWNNAVLATDLSANIAYANKQAEEMLAFELRRVIGSPISDVLPAVAPLVMRSLETGKPQMGRRIESERLNLILNVTLVRGKGGVKGAVCSFQPMEQIELTAQSLESYTRLNRQLNAIFESSSDGIWVCDSEGKVIKINGASEKLNGIKARDVIGKNVSELVTQGLFDRSVTLEVLEAKRQASVVQYVKKTRKDLLVTGTPAFDNHGNIYLVVVNERDMTQLNAMRGQLEQSRMFAERYKDELLELSLRELRDQEIVAESEPMQQVLKAARKLAKIEASNILLLGESGTGKGLLARFIHQNSRRQKMPCVQINCAALPDTLLEAELFGYEKGAFTGATEKGKVGLFELADKGTLFLDEIGELPLSVQAKLLKYLDDQEVLRLGGVTPKKVDCVILAATNRNLEGLVKTGRFRQDLYFRLNTFPVRIPPLRERPEDLFELTNRFLKEFNSEYGQNRTVSPRVLAQIKRYPFPGNVRELKNIIKMAVVMSETDSLDVAIVRPTVGSRKGPSPFDPGHQVNLHDEIHALEGEILRKVMASCRSTREMADHLGVNQSTVVRKLRRHGLHSSAAE